MRDATIVLTRLADAQALARENPETFTAPTQAELLTIRPGDFVKVCREGERFWILVTSIQGDEITGTVNNELVLQANQHLTPGQSVLVWKRHCYDVLAGNRQFPGAF